MGGVDSENSRCASRRLRLGLYSWKNKLVVLVGRIARVGSDVREELNEMLPGLSAPYHSVEPNHSLVALQTFCSQVDVLAVHGGGQRSAVHFTLPCFSQSGTVGGGLKTQ